MVTLTEAREGANLSQSEVARDLAVNRPTVWRWEQAKVALPAWALQRLAKLYGVPCESIDVPEIRQRRPADAVGEGDGS